MAVSLLTPRPHLAVIIVGVAAFATRAESPTRAGKSESPPGSFLVRAKGQQGFEPLRGDLIKAGELLVALPGATVISASGAVAVTSRSDFEGTSPLPILETAFSLNPARDADLDLTLDRGRIDLTNRKPTGAATARVRFQQLEWVIGLDSPGARVGLEVISRWPAGSEFHRNPSDGHEPVGSAVLIVLNGSAHVSDGKSTLALQAPPGPAMVEWSSAADSPLGAAKLQQLPAWAEIGAEPSGAVRKTRQAAEQLRKEFADGIIGAAVGQLIRSPDPNERRVGLIAAGATDDLGRMLAAVSGTGDPDTWDFGVSALRHWVGRSAGQDVALYRFLTDTQGFTAAQAETLVRLLHGFSAEDRAKPETYEVLIEYLQSEQPAIRNLSAWHLRRLVPKGKEIPFRPSASKAECVSAYDAWKAMIPAGQLPPDASPPGSSP